MPEPMTPEVRYPPSAPPAHTREWYRSNAGWTAIVKDWRHFCRVHGAVTLPERLMVGLSSRSLWALAAYRFGRWAYCMPSRRINIPARVLYHVLYLLGQYTSKVAIDVNAEVGENVFVGPIGLLLVGPDVRIGAGSFVHGHNTLGVGGRPGARGLPILGDRVHVGPGAMLVGPLLVPDDAVIGPNSVVTRTLPASGAWLGAPAKPYAGDAADLIPCWHGTWRRYGAKR